MPRKAKSTEPKAAEPKSVEAQQVEPTNETQALTKDDYIKAKATIKSYREAKKSKPKRPCSEKQLAALAAGREKNRRFANKTSKPTD